MKTILLCVLLGVSPCLWAQVKNNNIVGSPLPAKMGAQHYPATDNIYTIRQQYLQEVLHNPTNVDTSGEDNDLERFNRWFNFVEPRCYPTGNLPQPDVLLREYEQANRARKAGRTTSGTPTWTSIGPDSLPSNYYGIGRINCITMNPQDTNTLYVGAPCGGVWISHNSGLSWTTNTDGFPSMSIADIAVNPVNPDTIYAATGDGYGNVFYGAGLDSIFWGGLYTAGIMKSTDGGASWNTTGMSYIQSTREIIHRLLVYPRNPDVLLASTSSGIYRSADGAATWTQVDTGYFYGMEFHPNQPDTIYAAGAFDLRVSYDAGVTWQLLSPNMGKSGDRWTIALSPAAPKNIWLLNDSDDLLVSHDEGHTFQYLTSPSTFVFYYGYYDRVLRVSPSDSNLLLSAGMNIGVSYDGGNTWAAFDSTSYTIHPDNHAITFNPQNPSTIFFGNDGGIVSTHDAGNTWQYISNGLTISQIYRMSSSRQNPYRMLCGLQDNANYYNDGIGDGWVLSNGPYGDGMDCAIFPGDDDIQIASTQNANFWISYDQGATFTSVGLSGYGYWTSPVAFDPYNADTIYFGNDDVYQSFDGGVSANQITYGVFAPTGGVVSIAVANSNPSVVYAASLGVIYRTTDAGITWTDVTGNLASYNLPITRLAVDYKNPMLVYATISGYTAGDKVFASDTGGTNWVNVSTGLPNLPVNCIVTDSSIAGALYIGTDIGVYYTDSTLAGWAPYGAGLPNVEVQDLEINYTNRKLRAPTYGRGVWEVALNKYPVSVPVVPAQNKLDARLYPNPATAYWQVKFSGRSPANLSVTLTDATGRTLTQQKNNTMVSAASLSPGIYMIHAVADGQTFNFKAIKR